MGLRAERPSSLVEMPFSSQHSRKRPVMPDISREEIDVKLELVEARTETRFVELNSKLDRLLDANTSFREIVSSEFVRINKDLKDSRQEVKRENSATRWTIVGVVIASVLTAVAAIWVTQCNLLAAFQAVLAATATPHH